MDHSLLPNSHHTGSQMRKVTIWIVCPDFNLFADLMTEHSLSLISIKTSRIWGTKIFRIQKLEILLWVQFPYIVLRIKKKKKYMKLDGGSSYFGDLVVRKEQTRSHIVVIFPLSSTTIN